MTTSTATRPLTLPSAPVLIGGTFVLCVLGNIAWALGRIVFTDVDPHEDDGPIESIIGVGSAGVVALVLALAIGLALRGTPGRNGAAAIVLALLAIPSIVAFWSGATAVIGVAAAWKAGLTRGATPLGGAARVAGLFGLFLAIADVVLIVVALAVG